MPQPISLEDRLNASLKKAKGGASLIPAGFKRKEDEEPVPDISEVIPSNATRLRVMRLSAEYLERSREESAAKKAKDKVGTELKELMKDLPKPKFQCDGLRVAYFGTTRSTLSKERLLAAGISPQTINKCTETSTSYSLRITEASQTEGDE